MKSPKISGPLTKLQCCPISDEAIATVLVPEDFTEKSCMKVAGYNMRKLAADRLLNKTNRRPTDVNVELLNCFSANKLMTYKALGLCPPSKAGELIDLNAYGVINPSRGLISAGHPLGATGLAQYAELCWWQRQRQVPEAKLALQRNLGLGGAVVVALYQHGFLYIH